MAKPIRVMIGSKEYSLRGDDEELIKVAADEVNRQLEDLGSKHHDESTATLSILTALNIAEKMYRDKKQIETDKSFILNELGKMTDFLSGYIN